MTPKFENEAIDIPEPGTTEFGSRVNVLRDAASMTSFPIGSFKCDCYIISQFYRPGHNAREFMEAPITLSGASKRKRIHWGSFALGALAMLLALATWNAMSLIGVG